MRIVNFGFESGGLGALRGWGEGHAEHLIDHPEPQYFLPPTSGTAANGKPIFSWDQAAQQITRSGASWSAADGVGVTITYAFRSTAPASMPSDTSGFSRFGAAQIAVAEEALRLWSEVANINFTRVGTGTGASAYSNNATILFGNYSTGPDDVSAFAFFPSPGATAANRTEGDVWVDVSIPTNAMPVSGDIGAQVLAHEIGHAIGLSHPGNYNGGDPTYEANASYWQDARMFSIMSYFGSTNSGGNLAAFAAGPQLHDIAAAQLLYGAETIRTGNTTYGFHSNTGHANSSITSASATPVFAIWDSGGIDTLDLSGYNLASEIDLRPEGFSSAGPGNPDLTSPTAIGNISIARGVIIENAIGGGGGDTLIGNDSANRLTGNGGADTLDGMAGTDTMIGGSGNDILIGSAGADTLQGGDGVDTVSYTGSSARVVVRLWNQTAAEGDAQGDTLSGFENATGGSGNDTILGANSAANVLNGGAGHDSLDGLSGDDTLVGGAGGDVLKGGDGIDTVSYAGSAARVLVRLWNQTAVEGDAQGDTLSGFENVTGGSGNDTILGANSAANVLNGGAGHDSLDGLSGDDTLVGGAGGDVLKGGDGIDTVSYTGSAARVLVRLWNQTAVEGDAQGDTLSGFENATGGSGNDTILGANGAANVLNGGAGVDSLDGLSGNDTLIGGAGGDILKGGDGTDTVSYSSSTARVLVKLWNQTAAEGDAQGDTLSGFENVTGGSGNDTILGANSAANVLNGGAGNDSLDGLSGNDTLIGGAGGDVLKGGAGADAFVFNVALGAGNIDKIIDFNAADDVSHLSTGVFAVGAGGLAASAFVIGAAAADADDRIIYNSATGALLYDADGNGAGGAVQFATLATALALTNDDFFGIG